MAYPTHGDFVIFLDLNPGKYKNNPEPDGYNPTSEINADLTAAPLVPNPDPQPDIPKPFTTADTQALLSNESIGKLSDSWWSSYTAALNQGSREEAKVFVVNAEERADILDTESTAIQAELDSVIPDPDWPAMVPGYSDAMTEWNMSGWSADFTNAALGR